MYPMQMMAFKTRRKAQAYDECEAGRAVVENMA